MRPTLPKTLFLSMLTLLLVCASGCGGTRTVLVPEAEPKQLAGDVQAYIYVPVKGADGKTERQKSKNKVTLKEGQWVVSDDGKPLESKSTDPTKPEAGD